MSDRLEAWAVTWEAYSSVVDVWGYEDQIYHSRSMAEALKAALDKDPDRRNARIVRLIPATELEELRKAVRWADDEMSQFDFAALSSAMLSVKESGSNRYTEEEKHHAQTLLKVLEGE